MNIKRLLIHDIVYWAPPTFGTDGTISFDNPTNGKARWEEKGELFLNSDGQETVSNSLIITDWAMEKGGYAWKGKTSDLSVNEQADPRLLKKSFPIKKVEYSTHIAKKDIIIYKVFL
jgi:hypothetical protein